MGEATIIGVDLTNNVFQVHGLAVDEAAHLRKKLSLAQLIRFATSRD